jgi:ankyrin repeat protein
VQATLDKLSKGSQTLEKAYEDAIKRLESQLPDDAALATRIISWIVFAERAFTITELRHALAVEMGESSFDPDNILDTEDIVSVCAGLVTVDKKSNIIRLVHYTAHEYFDSIRGNWIPHSQLDITRTCLTYMSFNVFNSGHCSYFTDYKERLDKYPFLEYAAQYWGRHAISVQDAAFDLVCATILDQGLLSSVSQVLDVSRTRRWLSSHRFPTKINILHMLAYFGLHILAEKLLLPPESKNNYWVTQKDGKEETCLYVAAKYGQDAMVETLLQSGAEINDEVGKLGSVLKIAIHGGHLSTVKILLDNGADINMNDWPGVYGSTALHLASECDNIEMVQLLLDHGADVTARNFNGHTPVEVAAQREMYSIAKLLLDYRPEGVVVTADKPRYTPRLLWVCAYGHSKAVKLFLDQGADVNMSIDQGWTPLHAASVWGHLDVVQTLLDNGADPTLLNDSGQTPLRCALSQNHFSIVELLLSKEVDLDIRGKLARTIMDRASGSGVVTLVRLLLEKGFEVDLTKEHGRTPISTAAMTGQLEVFKLLLEHGADFNIPDETGNTPLHNAASYSGCLEVIRLLLEKKAVFSTFGDDMDRHSRNLLHVAAQHGSLDVFLYLKGLGIDPLSKDAKGDGLLSYAASSGFLPVLEAALSIAHVSAVQYEHWSPLHWACRAGSERLIKRLVLSGLQCHIVKLSQSEDSWSPADVAIHFGHAGMLQDLSDSCKTALGPVAKPERTPGTLQRFVSCDGCFQVSYSRDDCSATDDVQSVFGPRFKCQTCPDFDYCFMCMPFLSHLHEGHQWEKI